MSHVKSWSAHRRTDRTPYNLVMTLERGWTLLSAEARRASHPDFVLPPLDERMSVAVGQAVKLLFDIETKEGDRIVDRGVDRMWVIVRQRVEGRYVGVLDSDPGRAENLLLRPGDEVEFGPEHITDIDSPPREYVIRKYGARFFDESNSDPTR